MIVDIIPVADSAPRADLSIWEPPVLEDLGSADLVAFNPFLGGDGVYSAS